MHVVTAFHVKIGFSSTRLHGHVLPEGLIAREEKVCFWGHMAALQAFPHTHGRGSACRSGLMWSYRHGQSLGRCSCLFPQWDRSPCDSRLLSKDWFSPAQLLLCHLSHLPPWPQNREKFSPWAESRVGKHTALHCLLTHHAWREGNEASISCTKGLAPESLWMCTNCLLHRLVEPEGKPHLNPYMTTTNTTEDMP